MANSGFVWGIDIGQCGLKAIRGRAGEAGTVLVEAFEYLEYPKLLSQQDADPEELVRDAVKTFLTRNPVRGDRVAISVSGQSGLARFIKLPPVDEKQLPNLVGYEAKQQIPFALEDVVWDYQRMPTLGGEDDEFAQTEVGLFAMKRDQVLRLIRPLVDAEVEIDVVQLTPISIYNAIVFDESLAPDGSDVARDPNAWYVIFSMGTDASDLVLTNGARVWQRSVPIGGNHFTKQITTDLKLTFAKAEHTKRNAREAADPRKVFQSMRPVFNDLVTELQRTLGYFGGIERGSEFKRIIAVGNSLKLPGLAQFLEKNLEVPVQRIDHFKRLKGKIVSEDAQFKDNALTFPTAYGLVLQGLGMSPLRTNLIPREILKARMVRRKKPWIAAAAAALLAAFGFNFFFHWRAWNSVHPDDWKVVKDSVTTVETESSKYETEDAARVDELKRLDSFGEAAVGSADGRLLWLELLKAITVSLPVDETLKGRVPTLDERPLLERKEIFIDSVETEYFTDLSQWFTPEVQARYEELQKERLASQTEAVDPNAPADPNAVPIPEANVEVAVTDPEVTDGSSASLGGWVIEIKGHHFQHKESLNEGNRYLREKLLDQLESGTVELPVGSDRVEKFTVKELGMEHPVLLKEQLNKNFYIINPKFRLPTSSSMGGGGDVRSGFPNFGNAPTQPGPNTPRVPERIEVPSYEFTIQFSWKQTTLRERLKLRNVKANDASSGDVARTSNPGLY
ncbi:MAG TPA: pilus assembly protein PilM [Pirellulaceae bacterium]